MKFEKSLLFAGLLIAGLSTLSVFLEQKEITIALVACAFALPGLILSHYKKTVLSRSYVLILITWLVPVCLFFIHLASSGIDERSTEAEMLISVVMSSICSVTFPITAAKIYKQKISVLDTLISPCNNWMFIRNLPDYFPTDI